MATPYLHDNKELFRDAINLAHQNTGLIIQQAIEKDYYVSMLLRLLSQKLPFIVFKGGTSLVDILPRIHSWEYVKVSF